MFMEYIATCRYAQVYNQIRENIQQADAAADLKWWSANRGPEMKMSWPTYEVCRSWFQFLKLLPNTVKPP